MAQPLRPKFISTMGRRVRELGLSDMQKRAALYWGTECRARLPKNREAEQAAAKFSRERDSVLYARPPRTKPLSAIGQSGLRPVFPGSASASDFFDPSGLPRPGCLTGRTALDRPG